MQGKGRCCWVCLAYHAETHRRAKTLANLRHSVIQVVPFPTLRRLRQITNAKTNCALNCFDYKAKPSLLHFARLLCLYLNSLGRPQSQCSASRLSRSIRPRLSSCMSNFKGSSAFKHLSPTQYDSIHTIFSYTQSIFSVIRTMLRCGAFSRLMYLHQTRYCQSTRPQSSFGGPATIMHPILRRFIDPDPKVTRRTSFTVKGF